MDLIERVRQRISQTSFDDIVPALRLSFSAGVTECAPDEASHIALERADGALYRAKAEGRDRTVVVDGRGSQPAGSSENAT